MHQKIFPSHCIGPVRLKFKIYMT